MLTRCFERDNEVINISEYGFEWYVDDKLIFKWYVNDKPTRAGLVENLEENIKILKSEGFEEVL